MIAEIGLFALILALAGAAAQGVFAAFLHNHPLRETLVRRAAWVQLACLSGAFALLIACRVQSDFSVQNVADHSNRSLPLLYKIVGAWGNHEGSMLLWVWVLALFGAWLTRATGRLVTTAAGVQGALGAVFTAFLIFTSNPFARIFPPPFDGAALNPLLQDIGLALHPPMLYVGYVGFSLVFSLAVSALLHREVNRAWAKLVQPWVLIAWSFLTLGIGLGSWWAYRELGWGGYWFWDPVENASLLPWLAGTALLHSNMVLEKRGTLGAWVVLLAILTFAMSMLGTFLVRSGLITSVHSFASDPTRGLVMLGAIALLVGSALTLYALRAHTIEAEHRPELLSREGLILWNNLFFITACLTVLLGTLYPLIAEWMNGEKISVGTPYFAMTFLPLMTLPVLLAALAPLTAWQRDTMQRILKQGRYPALAAAAGGTIVFAFSRHETFLAAAGIALAAWLAAGSIIALRRGGKRAAGTGLSHLGAALIVAGVTGMGLWKVETEIQAKAGDAITAGPYTFTYRAEEKVRRVNHDALRVSVEVSNGTSATALTPEFRRYHPGGTTTSEAAIASRLWGDVYTVVGEPSEEGTSLRIYLNPLVHLLWLGCMLMGLGGFTAFVQRTRRMNV